jgi:hypothetical protein
MLPRALKYCDANEREWEDRPSWWGNGDVRSGDDQSLIWGILEYGYGGFDEMVDRMKDLTNLLPKHRKQRSLTAGKPRKGLIDLHENLVLLMTIQNP